MTFKAMIKAAVPPKVRALARKGALDLFGRYVKPMDLVGLAEEHSWSEANRVWNTALDRGIGGWVEAPNHSQGFHGLLAQWWSAYGLGTSCLLVSESTMVREFFSKQWPGTRIVATDFYLDLGDSQPRTDVVWDLYEPAPEILAATPFDSVICQATLEHLLDPVGVLKRLADLLVEGGRLYLHTHTPLFPYHAWPKDYVRFHKDWFHDVGLVVSALEPIEIHCAKGHAFAAYRRTRRSPSVR